MEYSSFELEEVMVITKTSLDRAHETGIIRSTFRHRQVCGMFLKLRL